MYVRSTIIISEVLMICNSQDNSFQLLLQGRTPLWGTPPQHTSYTLTSSRKSGICTEVRLRSFFFSSLRGVALGDTLNSISVSTVDTGWITADCKPSEPADGLSKTGNTSSFRTSRVWKKCWAFNEWSISTSKADQLWKKFWKYSVHCYSKL